MLSVSTGIHVVTKGHAPQPEHLYHRGHLSAALPMPIRRCRLRMFIAEVSVLLPRVRQHQRPLPRKEQRDGNADVSTTENKLYGETRRDRVSRKLIRCGMSCLKLVSGIDS
jgi:hypothetical protein